jgi:hypothetical protein
MVTTDAVDDKVIEALNQAIENWTALVEADEVYMRYKPQDCPLCAIGSGCESCIISKDTNRLLCDGTPFYSTRIPIGIKHIRADRNMLEYLRDLRHRIERPIRCTK